MRSCLFSVSFAGLWGQQALSLEQAIEETADLGFEGIEIMGKRPHLSVLDYPEDRCAALAERLKRRGLDVAAVAAYTNFTMGAESPEVPALEAQILSVQALARLAGALSCDLLRLFTSYEVEGRPFYPQWQQTVESLRECCDRAATYGVSIGVQNHHDLGVDTKAYLELLEQVDRKNLVPMYDCWSPAVRGEDVLQKARELGQRMRFTTVADYVILPRWRFRPELVSYERRTPALLAVPMGQGELDYRGFLTSLVQGGFDGWVSYEMCSPTRGGGSLENLRRYAREFLCYLDELRSSLKGSPDGPV